MFVNNNDLIKMKKWVYRWKMWHMCYNPGRTKQTHEVVFSRKTKNTIYCSLCLKNMTIVKTTSHLAHNILRLFNNLPNFCFTTSETKCEYH